MKNFDQWNEKKKKVQEERSRFYHEREIWWCTFGINVGKEQDGSGKLFQRPVLVVRGLSRGTCFIVPLTTQIENHPMRINLGIISNSKEESDVILSQLRVMDTRRFTERMAILDIEKFQEVRKNIKKLF